MAETLHHIGRKISRIRELRSMKQETLAAELGISQQAVSRIEQSESVEDDALNKIAIALGVTGEAIKNFTEESIFNYFNTFNDSSGAGAWSSQGTFNFNPIDKLVEVFEENKKLYERLLQSEREKVELLKQNKS
jgi:transcriptional regulator with XRE-family HTH domain